MMREDEMFYPSGDDVDRMIELAIQCGIDNRGTSWPVELCRVRTELRALLARTEAGADGVDTFAEWLATEMPAGTVIGNPAWWANRIARQYRVRSGVTHPQDASGDAEVAVAALREIYETGMYPEGHTLAGEHAYKGEYHADCIGIAERALAAMQAKEAK